MNEGRSKDGFVRVADAGDLKPGSMMCVQAHGDHILLINHERRFYALNNTCSHEDASLYQGVLDGATIRCPLHGSRFDIATGMPLEEPAEEPVAVYPVKVVDNQILIGPKP